MPGTWAGFRWKRVCPDLQVLDADAVMDYHEVMDDRHRDGQRIPSGLGVLRYA